MYLLDTNALSELLKKRPKPQFLTRLRRHPPEMFFTSIICVMELRHGSRRREDHAVFWPRITHKVARALKRPPAHALISFVADIRQSSVESVNLPNGIDCVITSPPYMNALDYGRDNRLRLWFLGEPYLESLDRALTGFGG